MKLLKSINPDMFSIFSKCIHRPDTEKTATKITFLVVGLDNAGKSTTAKGLQVIQVHPRTREQRSMEKRKKAREGRRESDKEGKIEMILFQRIV